MKIRQTAIVFGAALLLSTCPSWADEPDDGDNTKATIRLMSNAEAEFPAAVTKTITLPENFADDEAVANSARGRLLTANTNRLIGNQGIDRAEEEQQRRMEMAEAAQEAQENMGRSEDRPDPPNKP